MIQWIVAHSDAEVLLPAGVSLSKNPGDVGGSTVLLSPKDSLPSAISERSASMVWSLKKNEKCDMIKAIIEYRPTQKEILLDRWLISPTGYHWLFLIGY